MKNVWTEERTAEFMKIIGAKVTETTELLSNENLTTEERRKIIDDVLAWLDLMAAVDTKRKKQIREDFKTTIKNSFYAILKMAKIKKDGRN